MDQTCPGSDLKVTFKDCPRCGDELEFFTGDSRVKCAKCSTIVLRDQSECAEWCAYADQCFGTKFGGAAGG